MMNFQGMYYITIFLLFNNSFYEQMVFYIYGLRQVYFSKSYLWYRLRIVHNVAMLLLFRYRHLLHAAHLLHVDQGCQDRHHLLVCSLSPRLFLHGENCHSLLHENLDQHSF